MSVALAGQATSHAPAELNSSAVSHAFTLGIFRACHAKLAGVSDKVRKDVAHEDQIILIATSQLASRTNFNCSRSSMVRLLNSS